MKSKVKRVFRYKPDRMGNSLDKYYCMLCRWDFPKSHIHFDFTMQTGILWSGDWEHKPTKDINQCTCLSDGVDDCMVIHYD